MSEESQKTKARKQPVADAVLLLVFGVFGISF
jgi:hypothetical protein